MSAYDAIRPAVGGSLQPGKGYHDIPGVPGNTYRNGSQARADQIAEHIDVVGQTGLDLGCSLGGVSFGLVNHGATMYGFDLDATAIDIANEHSRDRELPAHFTVADLTSLAGWANVFDERYDFAVWLANWMWLAKSAGQWVARSLLHDLSVRVPVLAFETAQAGGSMAGNFGITTDDDVRQLLSESTTFTDIECIGPVADGWHARSLFIARR